MKTIILKIIVPDKDVEAVVKSARKHLPTWEIEVQDTTK